MKNKVIGNARYCQTVAIFFSLFFLKKGNNVCRAAVVHIGSVRKCGAENLKDRHFCFVVLSERKSIQENFFLAKKCKL